MVVRGLAVAVLLLLGSTPAAAKGGPYVVGATLSGGGLAAPLTAPIVLHEGYDDMVEAPPSPGNAEWYDITLDYDFEEDGYGRRQWSGKFDGREYLYFPDSMVVGPGVWAAGWYRANPLFMAQLQRALSPLPPATGSGRVPNADEGPDSVPWIGSALVIAALGALARPASTLG